MVDEGLFRPIGSVNKATIDVRKLVNVEKLEEFHQAVLKRRFRSLSITRILWIL